MRIKFLSIFYFVFCSASFAQIPTLKWAKSMGGLTNDIGNDIAVDAVGNVYTIGNFSGTSDFNYGAADFLMTSNGSADAFLVKYNASGNFIWAKSWGGTGSEIGKKISISPSGNIYVSGTFSSTTDFDPNAGVSNLTPFGSDDIYISKFDSAGNIKWVKQLGGSSKEILGNLVSDNLGNIICTGSFLGTADFDPSTAISNLVSKGAEDVFVSKLDSNGTYLWVKQIGAKNMDLGFSVCTDNLGNVITTGCFADTVDFDPNIGVVNLKSKGFIADIFITKYDASGNYLWAKQMGGYYSQTGLVISVDTEDNIYNLGKFTDTADMDPNIGVYTLRSKSGGECHYLLKLNPSGNFVWASNFEGANEITPTNINIDKSKNLYITGKFWSKVDFDPGADSFKISSNSNSFDIFVSKLDSMGKFIWANSIGSTSDDIGNAIKIDAYENIYTTGSYQKSADFDPGPSNVMLSAANGEDIFIQKLSQNPATIKQLENQNDFLVYPNPSKGIFTIQFQHHLNNLNLEVYNVMGLLVLETSVLDTNSQIDISNLNNGLYFLKIKTENGEIAIQKILKQ